MLSLLISAIGLFAGSAEHRSAVHGSNHCTNGCYHARHASLRVLSQFVWPTKLGVFWADKAACRDGQYTPACRTVGDETFTPAV